MIPVQFITHTTERYSYEDAARLALDGGCRWVQLRVKGPSDDEVRPLAERVLALCRERGATLIVDDRVDLAKAIGADGVHLGREDVPVAEARERLGEAFLIGGTANTFEDVERLCRAGVDYIGCGPLRFTTTKERLAPVLGLSGYASLMARMADAGLHTPVVAIGGVTCADVPALMATGVRGVAVSGAILRAADPVSEMDAFLHADE